MMAGIVPYTDESWRKTHADRVRAMSDEEIATFIIKGCLGRECPSYQHLDASRKEVAENCWRCWLDWLKEEPPKEETE